MAMLYPYHENAAMAMKGKMIRRILYYTHNSTGVGHVFRARAIITGIQKWRPDIDFLVLSGTSIPHILLREGIEVVKLPGVEKMITDHETTPNAPLKCAAAGCERPVFKPRYLKGMTLDAVMRLRRKIIAETCRCFQPDVVMIEHYMGGLLDEMATILERNRRTGRFISVAFSRGIMGPDGEFLAACGPHRLDHLVSKMDYIYIFDDSDILNRRRYEELKLSATTEVACVGRITDKRLDELPHRREVQHRFRLTDKPIVLMSLSRYGDIAMLCIHLLKACHINGIDRTHQIIFVIDPYLKKEVLENIQRHFLAAQVRFLPFFYPLIDLIHASELVICRAGYNTINELLLTGVKAIVVPEAHSSGEQEARAAIIPHDNIIVLSEETVLKEPPTTVIRDIVGRRRTRLPFDFDKYAIGQRIITDLEQRHACLRGSF